MKATFWMLLATLGTAACDGSMMSDPDRMQSMIDDARLELDAHVDASAAAVDLAEIRGEMDRHDTAMVDMMSAMDMAMDGMSHCTGAGMMDLRDMHASMVGEMDDHGAAMSAVATLDAAATEMSRHAMSVDGMMDGMDAAVGRMGCM